MGERVNVETTVRVVSQKIFRPDPKNAPELELGRVELMVSSLVDEDTTATRATLIVPKGWLWDRFLLGRELLLTITDSQQELPLGDDTHRAPGDRPQGLLTLPTADGGSVTATLEEEVEETLGLGPARTKRQAASRRRGSVH